MERQKFEELLKELDGESVQTLITKNARYSSEDDALHNFAAGADISGGTAAQACWGYLTKHLVALRDMVQRNDFHNREDLLEKCQDSINYIRFLWCIANEEMEKYTHGDCSVEPDFAWHCKICGCTFGASLSPSTLIHHLLNEDHIHIPEGFSGKDVINKYFEKEIL